MTMSTAEDPYDLARFLSAQAPVIDQVFDELADGEKRGHWMWFIFPQISGLGIGATSRRYSLRGLDEAKSYLDHPVLGDRLIHCSNLLLQVQDKTAEQILGEIDAIKLRSSMTLFARTSPAHAVFREVLDRFFEGREDESTVGKL